MEHKGIFGSVQGFGRQMRKFFFIFFFILVSSHSFADFSDHEVKKFLQFDMSSSTSRGIERGQNLFSGEAALEAHWWDAIAGIQAYEDVFDFTIAGESWLPFTNWYFDEARLALGLGLLYHFQRYKDISSEHDYMLDSVFRYHSYTGFTLTFRGGYSGKTTRIDELADYVPLLHDHYPVITIRIEKLFSNGFELYYENGSHDMYRYPIFCTPDYILGMAINLESGLRFGGEMELRFSDQYTTAPYLEGMILRMTARYTF